MRETYLLSWGLLASWLGQGGEVRISAAKRIATGPDEGCVPGGRHFNTEQRLDLKGEHALRIQ